MIGSHWNWISSSSPLVEKILFCFLFQPSALLVMKLCSTMIWWGHDLGKIQKEMGCFRQIMRKSWIIKVQAALGWDLLCGGARWKLPVLGRKLHENLVTCTLFYNYLLQSVGFFLNYSHCWRQVMGLDRPLAGQPGISCILTCTDPLIALLPGFILLLCLTARMVCVWDCRGISADRF